MKAAVDRIDEGIAVLIDREDDSSRFRVPVSDLPPGTKEGDILTITFERDAAAAAAVKKKVSGLIEKLQKGA